MPAQIVVALEDWALADNVAVLLKAAGADAAVYRGSHVALTALERASTVRVLVTSVDFQPGQPNGVALSRMVRLRRPSIKTVFVGDPLLVTYTNGLGQLLSPPISAAEIAGLAMRLLEAEPDQNSN